MLLSAAMSVDGYLDDTRDERLLLSSEEDFDRVDAERASCDAILVGANTIRRDDPRLLVRSEERRTERTARGLPPNPIKVTVTASGRLDPERQFFTAGESEKLVYTSVPHTLPATVIELGTLEPAAILADLAARGVRKLMVEGGTSMHTQLLTAGLADELHLVVAPFFVGDPNAPRFVHSGQFRWSPEHPMRLHETRRLGNVVLLRYFLDGTDDA